MRVLPTAAVAVCAILAGGPLVAAGKPKGNVAFADPPFLWVGGNHSSLTLDAYVGRVEVPGLGRVEGASFFDLNAGTPPATPHRRNLMPQILRTDPGSTIEVRLRNHLTTLVLTDHGSRQAPDATNIHTHGLIVPPTGVGFATKGGTPHLGDCVFPLVASTATGASPHGMAHEPSGRLGFDACARPEPLPQDMSAITTSGDLLYSYSIARDHPSGLFWIHPHPHTQSEIQLSNGLSSLMVVGSIWNYLSFDCRATASPYDPTGACKTQEEQRTEEALERRIARDPDGLKIRYLGLKDIQVQERADSTKAKPHFDLIPFPHRPAPDAPDAEKQAFENAPDRKGLCGDLAPPAGDRGGDIALPGGVRAKGVCWAPEDPKQPAPRAGWAFTVSGQVFPQIDVRADMELWRIANMSADITYRLRLETDDGQILSMQPVALDGVALAASEAMPMHVTSRARRSGLSTSGRGVTEITLMPSARTELLVRRCGKLDGLPATDPHSGCLPTNGEIHATLRTRGVFTGATPDDGDTWPAIDLARVHWSSPRKGKLEVHRLRVTAPSATGAAASDGQSHPAPQASQSSRVAAPTSSDNPCHPETYDHGFQPFSINAPRARLIRLNNHGFDEEAFGIHDEVFGLKSRTRNPGEPVRISDLAEEGAAPPDATGAAPRLADIDLQDACQDAATNYDGTKPGGVPKATQEIFETYYRPFKMDVDNVTTHHGATEYWLVVNDAPECHNFHIHQMKFAVLDADFVGGDNESWNQCAGDRKAERPINQRALQDNVPLPPYARVLLKVDFDGPKLGRFVFHCHILEHEDKGMMANIYVARSATETATSDPAHPR